MGSLAKFIAVAIIAIIAGVYAAGKIRDGSYDLVGRKLGPWQTWPGAGTPNADPYTRAHFVSSQRLPLSRFEVLELEARFGSTGSAISSSCSYRIVGQMPPVRRWSLSSYNVDDAENTANGVNSTVTSAQANLKADGRLELMLSTSPQTGNWLRPNGDGDQVLVLRLFNPTYSAGRDSIGGPPLTIERVACL